MRRKLGRRVTAGMRLVAAIPRRQPADGGKWGHIPHAGGEDTRRWSSTIETRLQPTFPPRRRSKPRGRCRTKCKRWPSGTSESPSPSVRCRSTAGRVATRPKRPPHAATERRPFLLCWHTLVEADPKHPEGLQQDEPIASGMQPEALAAIRGRTANERKRVSGESEAPASQAGA